ncbi:TraR/DksA family transcriptional regulator [Algisphaera agarilytica]|uniref:DnaK suppressor protein n=1 Tax=Algisphaera agarilytica TaxID=1385975 RepID=A0A7X0LK79_9BACT|nr:TraR/DksA C4-type zinc finger protein [Algisphaera agarilytica]MBB6428673.1 DnaK suppressor protein [Algisphaera agarilytica]
MAKSTKKKSSRTTSATRKKTTKKKAVTKKVTKSTKKAAPKKKAAKKAPAKKTTTKKKVTKKAPAKKAATKKVTKKKAVKKVAKKKVAKKAASKKVTKKKVTKKKAVTKKAPAKKKVAKKAPAKKAVTKKLAKKVTKKKTTKKKSTFKAPRVPYASLAAAPAPAYNPQDHEPLTNAQLRKIKTGLTAKDLRFFRQELLERRAEIIGDVQGLEAARSGNSGEISHMPLHMADVGSDNYEQEFTLGLMESERKTILEIDDALQRIVDKTYGVCIESGKPISRPRLEAKPWAKYSIEVARERERRRM